MDKNKVDWSNDQTSTPRRSPKKKRPSQVIRRSTRKRSMLAASMSTTLPAAKKSRTVTQFLLPPVPTLTTLPYVVTTRLLLYLDVDTLENLSLTCTYFDQMISGRFLTSINFPFPLDFITEVLNADCMEKKPLLKLKCKKSKDKFRVFPDHSPDPNSLHIHRIIVNKSSDMTNYLVLSQMSLLSLDQIREVDLVPDIMGLGDIWVLGQKEVMDSYRNFDTRLLMQISRFGSLSHVTRLDVLVDQNFYLEQFMTQLPNLIELGLNILTRRLSKQMFLTEYLPRLESVVAASKAPVLKLTVVIESRHPVNKILKNSFIEKLTVKGPCTFNVFPVMERLKEVIVNYDTSFCTYWKSRTDDQFLHRAGLCCVNMGAMYENCPNIEKFMGVDVGMIPQKQSFNKWNTRVKKKFYKYYQNKGGLMELTPWAKARWFNNKPVVYLG